MNKLKIGLIAVAVGLAAIVRAAAVEVTDVKIAQRYPWNGLVDITYTVKSDDADKDVWVYPVGYDVDQQSTVAIYESYLSGDGVNGSVKPGVRHMVWDMARQMGKNYNRAAFSVSFIAYCDSKPYMVVDLSDGATAKDYPISYLAAVPDGGWTDEYKTTKMLFRLVPPIQRGSLTITKPFYFAVWPMTTQQYALIMGGAGTSEAKTGLSYNDIRGSLLGSQYPAHQQVDADSIVGTLRLRTGITFDLATQWQWSVAAKGPEGAKNGNPNQFGIWELGSYPEWCLNWAPNTDVSGVDPVGPTSGYKGARSMCGGQVQVRSGPEEYLKDCGGDSFCSIQVLRCRNYSNIKDSVVFDMVPSFGIPFYTRVTEYSTQTIYYNEICRPVCRLVALPNCK